MNPFLRDLLSASARICRRALGAPEVIAELAAENEPSVEPRVETHTTWASPKTRAAIGIATWRLVIENGAERTISVEGIDGHGAVKFSTVIRRNPSDKSLYIESAKHSGAFKLAKVSKLTDTYLISNTINLPQWTKFTTAFKADWTSDKASAAARSVADIVDMLGQISSEVPRTQSKARVLGGGYAVTAIAAAMLAA